MQVQPRQRSNALAPHSPLPTAQRLAALLAALPGRAPPRRAASTAGIGPSLRHPHCLLRHRPRTQQRQMTPSEAHESQGERARAARAAVAPRRPPTGIPHARPLPLRRAYAGRPPTGIPRRGRPNARSRRRQRQRRQRSVRPPRPSQQRQRPGRRPRQRRPRLLRLKWPKTRSEAGTTSAIACEGDTRASAGMHVGGAQALGVGPCGGGCWQAPKMRRNELSRGDGRGAHGFASTAGSEGCQGIGGYAVVGGASDHGTSLLAPTAGPPPPPPVPILGYSWWVGRPDGNATKRTGEQKLGKYPRDGL